MYGLSYKKEFNKIVKETKDFKIRIVGSNISLDRFYKDIDTMSVIEELIDLSNPFNNEKMIFVWPEGILPKLLPEELDEYSHLFENKFN